MKKVCYAATVSSAISAFMAPHIIKIAESFHVTIVTSKNNAYLLDNLPSDFIPVEIQRKISLWKDAVTLLKLIRLFRESKFDIVHSITPKAGLLVMFSAWVCRVPIRIHTFTGQVWATKYGLLRFFLKVMDRLIVFFATKILVDSPSQLFFLKHEKILGSTEGFVLGKGSVCGVNTHRFSPNIEVRAEIRSQLFIAKADIVILFMGRLNTQKGILELAHAFNTIAETYDDVHLIVVGQDEDVTFQTIENICHDYSQRLHFINFTQFPESYMAASDILCLPSFREGFGQVIIESASTGIPAVASNIYGIQDAIENGVTGILFDVTNSYALLEALEVLINDKDLRETMGRQARKRAINQFGQERVTSEFLEFYKKFYLDENHKHSRLRSD